ncbi:MAG: DUF481 domain-containing protein [Halioglobus sp.]
MRAHLLLMLTLVLAAGLSHGATANRKTDIITFYNGDKITGEVKNLYAGLLEFSTDAMGTLKVEWQEIAKLESLYNYEVRLTEGKRYYGKIDKSTRPGEITVSDVYGEHKVSNLEIAEIRPVAISFTDRIDIYLALGYSYTKASSLGQATFNTDISYEDEKSRNALTARLNITDTDDDTTRSSKLDLSRQVWTNRQDVYRFSSGSYETNDELALDYRFSVGGGLGKYFTDSFKSSWTGEIGAQALTEKSIGGDTQESVEGILSTEYSTWKFDSPELNIKFGISVYPSFTESGRVRADSDLSFRWEIVTDLFWDITAFGIYDNKAADSDAQFDYGITTGLGWEY